MQHAGRLWTSDQSPSQRVLGHVTRLARHALEIIETSLMSKDLRFVRPAQLFRASNEGYDLVIQFKPDLVPNSLSYDLGSPFVSFSQPNFSLPRAGSDYIARIVGLLRVRCYKAASFVFENSHSPSFFPLVCILRLCCVLLQSARRQGTGHCMAATNGIRCKAI